MKSFYALHKNTIHVVCRSNGICVAECVFYLDSNLLPERIQAFNYDLTAAHFRYWMRDLLVAPFTSLYAKAKGFVEESDDLCFEFK